MSKVAAASRFVYDGCMEIRGKNTLITGAAKRVGREMALAFARKGANILLHYNQSENEAKKTASEIEGLGVKCHLFQADLLDCKQLMKMLQSIENSMVAIDILINSASLFYKTPLRAATETDFDKLVGSNLKAPFLLSKEIGVRMAEAGAGKIINIADWSAFRPYRDYAPYCAAKGGLITLTKSLARELAPKIMANAIAPGPVMLPPDFTKQEKESIAKLTALGRIGSPIDIAHAAVFLAENDFINGTVLVVDGGRSIV